MFAGFCKDQKTENGEPVFDDEGNPVYEYSLRYEEFIALIVMAVQHQQEKIENMVNQIDSIRDQILELKNKF